MRFFLLFQFCMSTAAFAQPKNFIKLSQDILYAVKTGDPADSLIKQLAGADENDLYAELDTEEKKLAFWLNIYNAFTQTGLQKNPEAYKKRNQFFSDKFFMIAGKKLSLDLTEHGLLRHSKWKYSLGHFNKIFISAFEKRFRLEKLDFRIHFALNCGARSCPPIAFYKPEEINRQLDLATKVYLKNEVEYFSEENRVNVPAIFSWFRGDFGCKKGIIKILKDQKLIPPDSKPLLKWKNYDWTLTLKNYIDQ